ncbi:ATP-binding protein [Streptomyces halobius]|uniref:ATP-binding protein n=1 Tax=Streptomyces halobius TaxID=2879846 RepID=A0ABY4MCW7_9ACTN|nr:ATP-binding protein [Streptomyces halobius]UQA94201.1 ATP-binding protein [Streptomyces halobius]
MSIWWSLHLRRDAASVPLARRLLLGTMETAGVDPDICYDLSVALSEACANAVEHAGDTATEDYRVTAFIDGDTCRIEVTDSGPGFHRPRTPAPPHPSTERAPVPTPAQAPADAEDGRGLFLIEALTDHVRYRNRPGRRGAVVSFDKILKWREGAALPMAS